MKKNQHYLPKAYLKFFATKGKKKYFVYAYFISDRECKYVPIDSICFRKYLYENEIKSSNSSESNFIAPNQLEDSFVEHEGHYASIIGKIVRDINSSDGYQLTSTEYEELILCFSLFMFRNPLFVHMSNYITENIYLRNKKTFRYIKRKYPKATNETIKAMVSHMFLNFFLHPKGGILVDTLKAIVKSDQLCILRTKTAHFITSDTPTVNIVGCKDGIEYDILGMPITPSLFLAFIDSEQVLDKIIDIEDGDVFTINAKQINSSAPTVILSAFNDLNEESCTQVIEPNELVPGTELFDGMIIDEENLKLYREMKESFDKKEKSHENQL